MQMLGLAKRLALVCLLVAVLGHKRASSMPTRRSEETTAATQSAYERSIHDYVTDEEDWHHLLDRLEAEAADSVRHPRNYVADEIPLEELIKLIESGEGGSTSNHQPADQQSETSAAPEAVETQTQAAATRSTSTEPERDECPVCHDDMSTGLKRQVKLVCKHRFHYDCLDQWLEHQSSTYGRMSCPMCRATVTDRNRD